MNPKTDMNILAWDAETCPQEIDTLTPEQLDRYEKDLASELSRKPDADPDEASRLVRALNPFIGWICCISVVRHDDKTGQTGSPVSFTAESPDQEAALLTAFWERVRVYNGFDKWVTFNGKKFDVEYVVTRSLACGVPVANRRLLETYPFRHEGHVDLKCLWQRRGVSFADVCSLLGVPSPKSDMDGSKVYPAILAGEIDRVRTYCEADALATLACYLKINSLAAAHIR